MTDRETVADWVGLYLRAWDRNEPEVLRAMFTRDAEYRYKPYEEPRRGHEAIIAAWLDGRDEAGDHRFSWEVVAVDEDVAVVHGRTVYSAGAAAGRTYSNLWVVRFADDGRASEFTEWWMEQPRG